MMGKPAFLFPGQGSQYPGMGTDSHDAFSSARQVFLEANDALGFPLGDLCLPRQVCNPVRGMESIQYLVDHEVDRFVEVGPGKVLVGPVKKIAPFVFVCSVDGIRSIEALASGMSDAKM